LPLGAAGALLCRSNRSARLRKVSAAVRRPWIDSRRTCGITASFTYVMAWRSSIWINSIASSRRLPMLGSPQLGVLFVLMNGLFAGSLKLGTI
jgi:hypothetical protein